MNDHETKVVLSALIAGAIHISNQPRPDTQEALDERANVIGSLDDAISIILENHIGERHQPAMPPEPASFGPIGGEYQHKYGESGEHMQAPEAEQVAENPNLRPRNIKDILESVFERPMPMEEAAHEMRQAIADKLGVDPKDIRIVSVQKRGG